ncbi:DUF4911 domain-containing protein [Oleidesulfovibrio sp.]|uniref:DUF4911 domain-containing protein n=1 Tax=Oleidesulfovibrio sp. TaxID=2909707 RepID=UPI003A85F4BA
MAKKRRRKPSRPLPPPRFSQRLYVQVAPSDIGMFRFLMEAQDNLGYMSVINKFDGILQVVFSPHQEREMRDFLRGMQQTISFSISEPPQVEWHDPLPDVSADDDMAELACSVEEAAPVQE